MWKKVLGYFLIVMAMLTTVVGIYTNFNKSPYCEWLAGKYDSSNEYYVNKYIEEFKIPSGSCYSRFTPVKIMTYFMMFGYGVYLLKGKEENIK